MSKKDFFTPNNFGGLPLEYSAHESSRVFIIPIPYEQTVSYRRGTREGPRAIIEASKNLELYDEELREEICQIGIHTLDEIKPLCGDPKEVIERIFEIILPEVKEERLVITLGGEHSISIASIRAHREKFKNLSVLQLDAHADLRDSYCGTKFSHASVIRRILDFTPVTQVGIRSLSKEEADFVTKRKRLLFFAEDIFKKKASFEEIISSLSDEIYLTIDLDVLDPSIMPSVGTPEPGGFQWYDILDFLRTLSQRKRIVGFDIVELAPIPANASPDFLVARLMYKLIGYIFKENFQNDM